MTRTVTLKGGRKKGREVCDAITRTGAQCQRRLPPGWKKCANHGGATPQAVNAARARIEAEGLASIEYIAQVRDDDDVRVETRLVAAKDLADRAGLKSPEK